MLNTRITHLPTWRNSKSQPKKNYDKKTAKKSRELLKRSTKMNSDLLS